MAAASSATDKDIRISAPEAMKRLEAGQPVLVLDVRAPTAWDGGCLKIPGAIRVSPHHFEIDPSWPKDRFTLVYCTCPSEATSAHLAHRLRREGYQDCYALTGGFDAWTGIAGPVEPKEDTQADPRAAPCTDVRAQAGGG